jgi:hypothetical protein
MRLCGAILSLVLAGCGSAGPGTSDPTGAAGQRPDDDLLTHA